MALYYVDSSCATDGSGTATSPYNTFSGKASGKVGGDEFIFRGGSSAASRRQYTTTVTVTNSGTSAASPIVIRAASGEYIEFVNASGVPLYFNGASYWTVHGGDSTYQISFNCSQKNSNGYAFRAADTSNIRLEYAEVHNGRYFAMVFFRNVNDWYVGNCLIYNNFIGPGSDAAGVQCETDNGNNTGGIYEYNTSYDCGSDCFVNDLPVTSGQYFGMIFRGNVMTAWSTPGKSEQGIDLKDAVGASIYDNTFSGFRKNDGSVSATGAGSSADSIVIHSQSGSGHVIRDNVFYNNSGAAVSINAPSASIYKNEVRGLVYEAGVPNSSRAVFRFNGGTTGKYAVHNNTVIGDFGGSGNLFSVTGSNAASAQNNIFYQTGSNNVAASATLTGDHNLFWESTASFGTSNYSTNPMFTNAAASIYTLLASSSAINAGVIIPGVTDGYTGSPDLGAYEFTGTAAAMAAIFNYYARLNNG